MPHSYRFGDPLHEIVVRDDGRSFRWPRDVSISDVKDACFGNVTGFHDDMRVVEVYRCDDGPRKTSPYKPEVPGKVLAVLAAVLGEDDAKQAIEALLAVGYQIVETPRPCR
jgi:hypothetical protein